ncbi:MAG: signal transduction histidine kinase [Flavobacteriaceae bacterium]|jgi:two-component system phosphate regulon sensor histidine kinase PhoR|uniref:sensor histidine kinase n=1 Tax=Candidatus Marifrigoribacter sp. Uisw_064 TaxID=3230970 RepID=UPI003AE4B02F
MKENKFRRIIYFISLVIALTLCVQGYWSYKNYQSEKQQFINDVQASLDATVEKYYTNLAKQNTLSFISDTISSNDLGSWELEMGHPIDSMEGIINIIKIDDTTDLKKFSFLTSDKKDSLQIKIKDNYSHFLRKRLDSNQKKIGSSIEMLTSKIIVSFSEDSLSIHSIDSIFQKELTRKNINIAYGLHYKSHWGLDQKLRENLIENASLSATSSSSFIESNGSLKVYFDDITLLVLKRNIISLLLSFLLVSSIVFCLLYLLKIIQKQKQLAAIKNDLISNITHEFKTPLATISVALEGIQRFNESNNPEKSKKYAEMSTQEVKKLTLMVEKLLETATLDSDSLALNIEEIDLVSLLERTTSISDELLHGKKLQFNSELTECLYKVDSFHFENALNNCIDNALKYGGDSIEVLLQKKENNIHISIHDNGNELTKPQANKIFEKFYRVPKGNTHDVKGFGIGLYYTKNIIEKHEGTIAVNLQKGTTINITLPNG